MMSELIFTDLEDRRGEVARHRENSARLAQAFARFETTGQGTIEFERRVDFGLTFTEEPYITYGSQIDMDELAELLGVGINDTPQLPLASGYITDWDVDERGFYLGCWCAVSVYYPSQTNVPADTKIHMQHHFTFTAIGMKDVPVDVRD